MFVYGAKLSRGAGMVYGMPEHYEHNVLKEIQYYS